MIEFFLLITGASAILTSSLRCAAKDCESCSFQTGCLWQSVTMSCLEAASCAPVGACVDRISFCSPRAMLAKALQEGRVETQIFSAFDRGWTPDAKSTTQLLSSFTCQLDECSTSLEPKNLCKVIAGVNLEVRATTDPKSETTMYTKYMYVCICDGDWDSGPNHRYCRRRVPSAYGSYGALPEPGPGYGVGYFNTYGTWPYGMNYGKYGPPPPLPAPPTKTLIPSRSAKQPRLIQFQYDDRVASKPNVAATNVSLVNSTVGRNMSAVPLTPIKGVSSQVVYSPLYPLPPSMPPQAARSPSDPSSVSPSVPAPSPSMSYSFPFSISSSASPSYSPSFSPSSSPSYSPSAATPSLSPTAYQILIPGEDPDESLPYDEGNIPEDESSLPEEGNIPQDEPIHDGESIPGDESDYADQGSALEEHPRNRTTLASLLPYVEYEDDGRGHVTRTKKNSTKPPKKNATRSVKGGEKQNDAYTDISSAPTFRPPPHYVDPQPHQALANPPPYYTLQSSDQMRLEFLEILVYSLSGSLAALLLCAVGYYCCRKRKRSLSPSKSLPSDTAQPDLELIPIPFSHDMDPELSRASEALSFPLPGLTTEDVDVLGRKACEDAWAKLGGLPGQGMSQVVIYYGTPYTSVVRPGDSTQSLTDECRSDVLVDVTLCPGQSSNVASSRSSSRTRIRFRYMLRRDANTTGSTLQSSRRSQSTDLSLVSNTACSSSASGTEY